MVLKMKLLFLMVFGLFMVMNVDCVEQKCKEFRNVNWYANTLYSGDLKTYYQCKITNANLMDESETATTDTQLNQRSNDNVTSVLYYSNNIIKFIPNSLFTTFINLEYFYVDSNNKLEIFKADFFQNANKLKNIKVYKNDVKTLGPNLFEKALNLEHINFGWNKIESIHKLAFNGLTKLEGVYLDGNEISNLHPSTFSIITKLDILELTGNTCINQKFEQANQKVSEVKAAIDGSCSYDSYSFELAAIEEAKLAKQQKIEAELKIQREKLEKQKAEQKIAELEQTLEKLEEKVENQKEEINQTISNFTSIIEILKNDKKVCSSVNAELTIKFEEGVIKQKSDAKMIVELNEELKKSKMQGSLDEISGKLEVKLMKLVEERIITQINQNKVNIDACKLEMKDNEAKLTNQKDEIKAIELKCSNNIQDLQRKVEKADNSHDERLRKLELKP